MNLLPPEIRAKLPRLYSTEVEPDPMVVVKFFTPWTNWTWYAIEREPDGDDFRFFGWVVGLDDELPAQRTGECYRPCRAQDRA